MAKGRLPFGARKIAVFTPPQCNSSFSCNPCMMVTPATGGEFLQLVPFTLTYSQTSLTLFRPKASCYLVSTQDFRGSASYPAAQCSVEVTQAPSASSEGLAEFPILGITISIHSHFISGNDKSGIPLPIITHNTQYYPYKSWMYLTPVKSS